MPIEVLRDAKLWMGGYEFGQYKNALALNYGAEVVDQTTFGATARARLGGLRTLNFSHQGFWHETPDGVYHAGIGVSGSVMTIGPRADGADGEPGFFVSNVFGEYVPITGTLGELHGFSISGEADGELIKGTIMHNAQRTGSGNGTARQLGAVSATQRVYASLHVVAASVADTLDVIVESDDNGSMTTPTTRITFTQATAIGAELLSAAGAITDDWWRVSWTIGGTDPDFTFIVAIGIK